MVDFIVEQWWLVVVVCGSMTPLAMQFARAGLLSTLGSLDRRWIFLLMLWCVLVPIYYIGSTGQTFPEVPSALSQATFDEIERLAEGDRVLLAFDYDPTSEGELGPMATAFVKHVAAKRLRMYFMALWPVDRRWSTTQSKGSFGPIIRTSFMDRTISILGINQGTKPSSE